jgi:competence protein ComEC
MFTLGAALFAGCIAAGLRPWYLTYAVLLGAVLLSLVCLVRRCFARRDGGADGGGSAGSAGGGDFSGQNEGVSPQFVVVAAATAFLPLLGYLYCVHMWESRLLAFERFDGRNAVLTCKVASPVERAAEALRAEVVVLGLGGAGEGGGSIGPGADTGGEGRDTGLGAGESGRLLLSVKFAPDPSAAQADAQAGAQTAGFADAQTQAAGTADARADAQAAGEGAGEAALRGALRYGNTLVVRGRLVKPARQQNEYLFDDQKYLYSRGLDARFYAEPDGVEVRSAAGVSFPIGAGIAARDRIESVFWAALPAREAALLTAILVGKTDHLEAGTRDDFMAAGLLHIMAVSGMHVALVAGLASALARRLGAGVRFAAAASLAVVLVFLLITGFSASVVRAAVAYVIYAAAKFFGKAFDSLNAIGLAALLILAREPMQAFGAGFQLSFFAAVSILVLTPPLREAAKRLKAPAVSGAPDVSCAANASKSHSGVRDALCASIAVQIGLFPIQATLFRQFPLLSIPANLLTAPLIGAIMAAGQLTAIAGMISPALAYPPAFFAMSLLWLTERVAGLAASVPFSLIRVRVFGPFEFCVYYGALAAAVIYVYRGRSGGGAEGRPGRAGAPARWKAAAACAVSAALLFAACEARRPGAPPGGLEVVFLDVGNANAAYLNIGGRYDVVVDAGGLANTDRDPANERRLTEYLVGRGVRKIDLAIATHGDADHIQGFWSLLGDIPVKRLMASGLPDENLETLLRFAGEKGAEIFLCRAGDAVRLGGLATVEVKSPAADAELTRRGLAGASVNDLSLVTRLVFGDMKALFCGDLGGLPERALSAGDGGEIDAQLMSVPHHGSKYSSAEDFLAAVRPQTAVAGVGRNSYGHPSPEAVGRYQALGTDLRRTDRDGMVTVRCDGSGILGITCYNDRENWYAWER